MFNYTRMINECFWDVEMTEEQIKKIVNSHDAQQKQYMFEKILLNSTQIFNDLKIFTRDELKLLIQNMKMPHFNAEHAFKRKNLVEVYFFDAELMIDELKWIA